MSNEKLLDLPQHCIAARVTRRLPVVLGKDNVKPVLAHLPLLYYQISIQLLLNWYEDGFPMNQTAKMIYDQPRCACMSLLAHSDLDLCEGMRRE
jgi:hypothetical protein